MSSLLLLCTAPVFAKPVLTVYTYDSFAADWGLVGSQKAFEADCNCELKLVALEDGVSLLNRLRMEGKNSKADVVLGLDNNLLDAASKQSCLLKAVWQRKPLTFLAAGIMTLSYRMITAISPSSMTRTN